MHPFRSDCASIPDPVVTPGLPIIRRPLALTIGLLTLLTSGTPAHAKPFEVYCVNNSDGTVSCQGWDGGEALTCVNNPGASTSCRTPSGRGFVCTQSSGGVTSCENGIADRPPGSDTNCVFNGDGSFSCERPPKSSAPLIPSPQLDRRGIDSLKPVITPSSDMAPPSAFGP